MNGVRTTKATALLVLLAGALFVIALAPASALAAWTDARATHRPIPSGPAWCRSSTSA